MKKTARIIIMCLMAVGFLIGPGILLYPLISNLWNEKRSEQLRTEYQATVEEEMTDELAEKEWKKAWEYNENLKPIIIPDSFVQAEDPAYNDEEYMSCLNLNGDGVMGYISIPKIGISIPIGHSTNDKVLETGAGHLHGSSLPAGGKDSHAVLAAHRGLPGASLFTDADQLELGDQFYLSILNETLAYEVDQILTVKPEETEALQVVAGEDLVTLVTCTPYAVNSHRLLIRGHRVPYEEETAVIQQSEEVHSVHTNYGLWIGIGIVLTAAFLGLFVLIRYLIKRGKDRKK